jgi:hypothetical protein
MVLSAQFHILVSSTYGKDVSSLTGKVGGLHSRFTLFGDEKNRLLLPRIKPRFLFCQARRFVTIPPELPLHLPPPGRFLVLYDAVYTFHGTIRFLLLILGKHFFVLQYSETNVMHFYSIY